MKSETNSNQSKIISFSKDYSNRLTPFNEVKRVDKTSYVYVKSGYSSIDNCIGGFILGQISVWSGLNGSGKSAFLNQQILSYIEQGYKVMLFSGELPDYSVKNSLYRLIAGKRYLTPSRDRTYYYLKDERIKSIIDSYIGNKLYIYNNKFGAKPEEIVETIKYAKKELGVQIVILDNLMTMNLRDLNYNKFEAQSIFANMLASLVKELQIHIHIVMHPTKTIGFLRKNDISGSADLSNAVDNVFIIHRNSNDFRHNYMEFNRKIKETDDFFKFNTYIEVCKNREEGVMDKILCFYFLPETKQIVENEGQEIGYINNVVKFYREQQQKQKEV